MMMEYSFAPAAIRFQEVFTASSSIGASGGIALAAGSEPPAAPTVNQDIVTPTNQDVTVTAIFAPDAVDRKYTFDGIVYEDYVQPLTIENNCTIFFWSADASGNYSVFTYQVTNIDKTPPVTPAGWADPTGPTNGNVVVSVIYSDDSAVQEYSMDNQATWQAYAGPLTMTENSTVYFRAADEVGNQSEIGSFTVNNIDRTPPEKPLVGEYPDTPTNRAVWVQAYYSADTVRGEYSLNNWIWHDYTGTLLVNENLSLYFRGFDAAGNVSEVTVYTVSNIDRTAPDAPKVYANVDTNTNYNVKLTVAFDADSVKNEYSIDGGEWREYQDYVVMTNNGVAYFRSTDAAGNISYTNYTVSNIAEEVKNGLVGIHSDDDRQKLQVNLPGRYTLNNIEFGILNAKIYIYGQNGKLAASGKVKNGILQFKETLLDAGKYQLVISSTDSTKSASYYATQLLATEYFTQANQVIDHDWHTAPELSAVSGAGISDEWVGFGDAVDLRNLVLASDSQLTFTLAGVGNSVKLSLCKVENQTLKTVKTVTAKAGREASLKNLLLDSDEHYVLKVEATGAAKGYNSNYEVRISGTAFDNPNNTLANNRWQDAQELDLARGVADEYVGYADAADWYKFDLIQAGMLDLELNLGTARAAQMTLYRLDETQAKLRKVASGTTIDEINLAAGQYFMEVVSADRGKGKKNTGYGIAADFTSYERPQEQGLLA